MARLKQIKRQPAPPAAREPLPEHVRVTEWNGFKTGDQVVVRMPGKKARSGYRYYFSAYVTSPGGIEYVDVQEIRLGQAHGLWRSFPPDAISAPYIPKYRRKKADA